MNELWTAKGVRVARFYELSGEAQKDRALTLSRISLQICIAIFSGKERPLVGTMVALACTYLTYALMPIRLKDALLAGTILAVTDVVLLVTVGQFDLWSHQVS